MSTVYLNGRFMPIEEACVSVTDRGFLFGDGVYEVIPAYGGRLFRLPHHLQRLQDSLDGIKLSNPLSELEWMELLENLLQKNQHRAGVNNDQSVYLQITRGTSSKRDHNFPAEIHHTVYACSNPIPEPDPTIEHNGVAAITLDDIRWSWCNIKAITLLPNVLLRQQAGERGAAEAILIRDGYAIEASSSNIFIVRDGNIITPPNSPVMLPGITRDLVLELAEQQGHAYREDNITEEALHSADEIWITSSTREIVPVTRLDDAPVGNGLPGPVWKTMLAHYRRYKDAVRLGNAG
ncbi:D-alanine transaminase [Thiogranum longum]|uniref:Aminodeoxychorismate lyase n=1 Tax=Thiogranum longum TaxID=1537524 RepID=A0A4R1HET2_9GAMM|nr:D-amino acid aminotransferase [Thiogranum longum]TCK19241.1 D-alanine transaminase [Thiogranum longum]